LQFNTTNAKNIWEGYAHFEDVTIGGVDRYGHDATNELTYLLIRSKKEFPLHYPELALRVHSGTPNRLLHEAAELIKDGTGFPKLFNDEEIIPFLMNTGISLQDAREYANGGCTEVRVPKLDTYLPQTCNVSMIPALEMALNDGYTVIAGKRGKVEEPKIKFADIKSFDDILTNYKQYVDLYIRNMYARMSIVELMDGEAAAAPFMSALHPCCLKAAEDIHKPLAGKSCGANYQDTGNIGLVGFGTVVESLIAIKKIVFEDKAVTLEKYMNAVNRNFENSEPLRQMILNAPKYGNNDPYADEIARQVDKILDEIAHKYRTPYGERYIKFVPVTVHQSLGMQTQATPNGRKAFEALSEGISPTQGYDSEGALATLTSISNARSRLYTNNAARLLNIKLSPQTVDGEEGTQNLIRLIRAWCDLKLWHLQFNIVNRETLLEAQKNPEAYRNLLVRVAGYSAFFTDLSEGMQNEIINRTEHTSC
jgi:formate C-acetyltransferase